jgi:hypothetical protein
MIRTIQQALDPQCVLHHNHRDGAVHGDAVSFVLIELFVGGKAQPQRGFGGLMPVFSTGLIGLLDCVEQDPAVLLSRFSGIASPQALL